MSKQGHLVFDERESLELLWERLPEQGRYQAIVLYASLIARGLRASAVPSTPEDARASPGALPCLPPQPIDLPAPGIVTQFHDDLTDKEDASAARPLPCAGIGPNT